ncbi:threonine-phosphate decarboxylase CobD [Luteibacter sp. Lutesp34]|uniref:threonine-phosphate decarboxylase CobD n=1 Tax=Luteibacter sp. Lutesp34 TaxID=3243030 RepID=UPI0039B3B0B9
MLEHGGRLGRAVREYGIPREAWLDLSTGVSPHVWPVPPIPPAAWHRLPEDDDALSESARAYYGVRHVLPVAGSQAAIAALPRLRGRSRVAVVEPGYAEHAHAWRQAGHDVTTLPMDGLLARADEFDVVVLIRPNNPTGDGADIASLLALQAGREPVGAATAAPTERAWLIVDEAFIDTRPEQSLAPYVREGIVVLRSVGKFFGLAGARAGFVVAWPGLLDALAEALGPWTLTGPTRHVVAQALSDRAWHASARAWLCEASSRLANLLTRHGLSPAGGCEFFHYCVHAEARALQHALATQAILVRHFDNPQALRFGLPGDDEAFARLDRALAAVLA